MPEIKNIRLGKNNANIQNKETYNKKNQLNENRFFFWTKTLIKIKTGDKKKYIKKI